jgi:hypothetical protein
MSCVSWLDINNDSGNRGRYDGVRMLGLVIHGRRWENDTHSGGILTMSTSLQYR